MCCGSRLVLTRLLGLFNLLFGLISLRNGLVSVLYGHYVKPCTIGLLSKWTNGANGILDSTLAKIYKFPR